MIVCGPAKICCGMAITKKIETVVDGTIHFDICQGQLVPKGGFFRTEFRLSVFDFIKSL